jgi:cytoskeletal protein CcmA (bactofilin family)
MAGYTRNDTTNQIADGNVINAAPLDGEFNAIESAFNVSSGHTHDGSTTGDGGPISKLGPSQETTQSGSTLATTTDITVATDKFIQFRDSGLKILSSADGKLDIDADTELEMVAPTVDIDASTAVTIDTATLTITGAANIVGDLDVDNININGTTIGHTDDTDLMTLASGILTVAGEVSMTTLDIGGTNVTATATELNLMDGGTSAGTTAVAGGDGIVTNDSGTMRQTTVDTFDTYLAATSKTLTNKTIDADNNTVSNIEVDNLKSGVLDTDLSSVAGTDTTLASAKAIKAYVDTQTAAVSTDLSGDSSPQLGGNLDTNSHNILIDTAHFIGDENGNEQLVFQTTSSAVNQIDVTNAATGGHPLIQASGDDTNINLKLDGKGSGVVNVVDGLTVGGNLTVNGTTTTVDTTNTVVKDSLIELGNGTSGSPSNDAGIVIERGSSANAFIGFDESEDKFTMGTGTFTGADTGNLSITKGTLVADIESSKLIATNVNSSNTGTDVAIQIGASNDWTVVVTSSDELVFRHNGDAKMLLTTGGHLKVSGDITAFSDLSSYDGS